jgi:hypothetical protein
MKPRTVQPVPSFQPPETCTEHSKCRAAQTPLEDLRRGALEHYEKVTSIAHEWQSVIPKAINAYFDKLITEADNSGSQHHPESERLDER